MAIKASLRRVVVSKSDRQNIAVLWRRNKDSLALLRRIKATRVDSKHEVASTNRRWHSVIDCFLSLSVCLSYQYTIHKAGCLVAAAVVAHPGKTSLFINIVKRQQLHTVGKTARHLFAFLLQVELSTRHKDPVGTHVSLQQKSYPC